MDVGGVDGVAEAGETGILKGDSAAAEDAVDDMRGGGGVFDDDEAGDDGEEEDEDDGTEPETARAGQEADFGFSAVNGDEPAAAAIKRPDDRLVIHGGGTFDVDGADLLTTSTRTFCFTFCFSAIFRRFNISP